jgi:hypothetical protein
VNVNPAYGLPSGPDISASHTFMFSSEIRILNSLLPLAISANSVESRRMEFMLLFRDNLATSSAVHLTLSFSGCSGKMWDPSELSLSILLL